MMKIIGGWERVGGDHGAAFLALLAHRRAVLLEIPRRASIADPPADMTSRINDMPIEVVESSLKKE